jgi:hypothetical protein
MATSTTASVGGAPPDRLLCSGSLSQRTGKDIVASISESVPFLDVRSQSDHLERRLINSYNLPLDLLPHRMYLLPDKATRFSVVTPKSEHSSVADKPASTSPAAHDHTQASYEDAEGFLRSRGWTNLVDVIVDCDELWEAAAEAGFLELHRPDACVLRTRWLFAPSPALAPAIPTIEAALFQLRSGTQQEEHVLLKCLDVGSGSCRDLAWLCARHHHHQHNQQPATLTSGPHQPPHPVVAVRWEVTGIDNWLAALSRGFDMLCDAAVPESAFHLLFATIDQATGALTPLEPGPKASPQLQAHLAASAGSRAPAAGQYDLLLCVRFLARSYLPRMAECLAPGGFVVVSTFVDCERVRAMGRPKDLTHVLQPGELAERWFGEQQGFLVLKDETLAIPDGRLLCSFLAQKLPAS